MRTLVAGLGLGAAVGLGLLQRSRLAERTLAAGRERGEREREASTRRPFSNGNKEEEDARTDGDESCSSQSEDVLCNSAANNVKSLVYNRNTQGERAAPHQVEGYTSRNVHNGPVLIFHLKAIKSEPN